MHPTLDKIVQSALTKRSAVWATYDLTHGLLNSGAFGAFVECGVYAGAHPAAMALAIIEFRAGGEDDNLDRKVHLFDSFEGIPMSGPRDTDWHSGDPGGRPFGPPNVSSRISSCSLEKVKSNMKAWGIPDELLVYHPGWFCDTIPAAADAIGPIALLRLDADLYESTRVCVEHLYPKVVPGGWCICDDWTLNGAREIVAPLLMEAENCPVYWRKQ